MSYSNDAWATAVQGWRDARNIAETEEEAEEMIRQCEDKLRSDYGLDDDEINDLMMKAG